MATTAGKVTVTATPDDLTLVAAAATGGTGPYTYQWYMSTTSGFTPGVGNIIAGATGLSLQAKPLPNVATYYVCIAKDSGDVAANTTELGVTWSGRKIKSSTQVDANQSGDPTGSSTYGFGSR